jgi:thiol-disulfide isomerase/thioredoxin
MKFVSLIVFSLFFFNTINAQKAAPDFKVTDIYDQTHQLYADYLDQNKYVFIDFFTPTCPSCQELAPKVDTVFKEFGCNYGDIIFLGIETHYSDSVVWNFVQKYTIGFPVASGTEGGGFEVINAYGYNFVPYKIIIDPNKKIISDNPGVASASDLRDSLINMGFEMRSCEGNDFLFYSVNTETDSLIGEIDPDNNRVDILVPSGTDLSSIRPAFVNAANSTVEINGEVQISGIDVLDFSGGPVTYTITSEAGISRNWVVSLSIVEGVKFLIKHITIYPNPCKGDLYIETDIADLSPVKVQIYDLNGSLVLEKIINNKLEYLNLSSFDSGVYFIHLNNRQGRYTELLILQN